MHAASESGSKVLSTVNTIHQRS